MAIEITYSKARENLAALLDKVVNDKEVVIVNRRGSENVAMIAASELAGLLETAHLLRSPKNAQRLLAALNRAISRVERPQSISKLREEIGLGPEKEK